MRIEIWADVVCGWAYIGKRRLEQALADPRLAGAGAEVDWLPFRIDPTTPDAAVPAEAAWRDPLVDAALRRCAPGLSPQENRQRISRIAADEGLAPWRVAWRASSHDAHRLLRLARAHGGPALQHEVAEQVMRAHFRDGEDISDRRCLAAAAARAGFPGGRELLDTGAGDREVRELLLIGKARGIATSPTIVVGDRALAGAQPPGVIADFLAAAASGDGDGSGGGGGRREPAEVRRLRWVESLLRQRDPLGALTLLRPLLDAHPGDLNVRRAEARCYFHSAQLARAHDALVRLVADAPDDSYARLMLGRTLQRLGRDDEAAAQLRLAAAMTPEYA